MRAMVQSLERSFGVDSKPVVVLLTILLGVAGLYTVTIPATLVSDQLLYPTYLLYHIQVFAYVNCLRKKKKYIPGTQLECKHHMDDDSTASITLYNEITTLDGYDVEPTPDVPPRRQSLFHSGYIIIDDDDVLPPTPPMRRESIKKDLMEVPALPSLPTNISPVPPPLSPPPPQKIRAISETIPKDVMSQTPVTVPFHSMLPPPLVPSPPATPQNAEVSLIIDTPPST